VSEPGLDPVVQIIQQLSGENLESLEHLVGEESPTPDPHLENLVGCETGAVLYFTGEGLEVDLVAVSQRIQAPGYGISDLPNKKPPPHSW
jgi:hypothetical protein